MSIFGELDAASIPTNPYYIEQGNYAAEVTKAEYRTRNTDNGQQRQLFIQYTITDEDSAFFDSSVSQFFNVVDADMTPAKFALLPSDEQRKIRRTNSAIKRTLCGADGNSSQKGLGVTVEELNGANWEPGSLVGTKVNIGIQNYGDNNEGVNLKWVNLAE